MQFPNNQNNSPPDGTRPPSNDWRRWIMPLVFAALVVLTLTRLPSMMSLDSGQTITIPYNVLLDQAETNNIEIITITGQNAEGRLKTPLTVEQESLSGATTVEASNYQAVLLPDDNTTLYEALERGDAIVNVQSGDMSPLLFFIVNLAPFLLLIGFLVWTARRAQRQMNGAFSFGRTQAREYTVERPQVTFVDVAGQDAAKNELVEIVDFLKEPDKYIALGARIPRGVLLIGPPGTGKTLLARAVAGEASVAFFSIAASEFVEMFVGVGASRVRDLFRRAKENAPSIVFIDEIDAVGRQRGAGLGGGNDEREQTLNQMLAEMDGFDQTESVIVMAATNRPDVLDPALLRPGRFDRQVTVALPDRKGRLEILKIHVRGKPLDATVNLADLSRLTVGFSGADLANLANEAALTAARRNARRISQRDFMDAFDRIVLGTESPPLSDANERRVVAYHEAGHALVAALTPGADPVSKVTIVPRGQALGVTAFLPTDDRRNYSTSYLRALMLVMLGGRAAERVVFDEVTTGAENDLRRVTDLARRMVSQFGMSDAIGPLNFGDNDRQPFLGYSLATGRTYSEETASRIDGEVRRIVDAAYDDTLALLRQNTDKLHALAEALLTNEVIEKTEMMRVIGLELVEDEEHDNVLGEINEVIDEHREHIDPDSDSDPQASQQASADQDSRKPPRAFADLP